MTLPPQLHALGELVCVINGGELYQSNLVVDDCFMKCEHRGTEGGDATSWQRNEKKDAVELMAAIAWVCSWPMSTGRPLSNNRWINVTMHRCTR